MSRKKRLIEQKRKAEALKKAERNQAIVRMVGIVIVVLIIAIIAGALIFDAAKKAEKELNYSIGLNEDGKIKGVNALKYVELCDFNALNMNAADFYPSKEDEEQYIAGITESYPDLSDKKGVEVKEKDMVNIDYVGTIDGVEYEGGNTNKKGIVLTLGVGNYPTDFENGIIGHKTGETFDITVDYDADFANEELAGKSVDYEITINGVFVPAEFNDAFVAKNFKASADSAEDFLNKYRINYAQGEFDTYVKSYIITDSNVKSFPASYLSKMKKYMKAKDYKQMETSNATYQNLYGYDAYKDVLEMRGMSKEEYAKATKEAAEIEAKKNLIYQALYEKFNLSVSDEDLKAVASSYGFGDDDYEGAVDRFGNPYIHQQAIINVVNDYLAENYNLAE